jgi:DNA replication protein DnaC
MKNTRNTSSTEAAGGEARSEACPICGGVGFVREDVPLGHPNFGRALPCQCRLAELEARRLADLRRVSNLEALARFTFDNFVPEVQNDPRKTLRNAYNMAGQFAAQPRGWLVLLGGYGCGKTHLAAAIANYRLAQGQPVVFAAVPDLLDHLRATYRPNSPVAYDQRFENTRTTALLILDDLGTQSSTPWAMEKLYQIFNYRYNAQLPTVITSNCPLEEIDARLRSRMVDPLLATVCAIEAPDFRGQAVQELELSSLSFHKNQTFASFELRKGKVDQAQYECLRRAKEVAREYAEYPGPRGWLTISGEYGSGKTHLAAAIANLIAEQGQPVLFIVVPDLLDHLRATYSPDNPHTYSKLFEQIRTAPFLVLDDLGTHSATDWAREKLYQLFNYRYVARLPTVITVADKGDIDPKLKSRMFDESLCTNLAILAPGYFGGGSARKKSGRR